MKVPCMKLECKCLSASHGLKKGAVKKKRRKKEKGRLLHLIDSFFSIPQRGESLTTRITCLLRRSGPAVWTCWHLHNKHDPSHPQLLASQERRHNEKQLRFFTFSPQCLCTGPLPEVFGSDMLFLLQCHIELRRRLRHKPPWRHTAGSPRVNCVEAA